MPQTDKEQDLLRSTYASAPKVQTGSQDPATVPMQVGLFYDMDACHGPTGVTRHALSQLERLMRRPDISLRVLTGRITHPDGAAYWNSLERQARWELPLRTRDILRWWRLLSWPSIEWWSGSLEWIYCPAEFFIPTRNARLAVTSHDVLQTLRFEPARKRDRLGRIFQAADLVLSVSHFNTDRLLEAFPSCQNRVVYVPNGADDLFFDAVPDDERSRVRVDLDLPGQIPYLLSVANFQPRKNLVRFVHAAPPPSGGGEWGTGDRADRHRRRTGSQAFARSGSRWRRGVSSSACLAIARDMPCVRSMRRRPHWCFRRCVRALAYQPSRRWPRAYRWP